MEVDPQMGFFYRLVICNKNKMIEYQLHELEGISKIFRKFAFFVHPRKKNIAITLFISLILYVIFFFGHEGFGDKKNLMVTITLLFCLGFLWPASLLITCNTFYPDKSYTRDNYALSNYEIGGGFSRFYSLSFLTVYFAFLTLISLKLLIMQGSSILIHIR